MTDIRDIYDRVQNSINIEDQSSGAINDWLTQRHPQSSATFSLAKKLSQASKLFEKEVSFEDVGGYEKEVSSLNNELRLQNTTLKEFDKKIVNLRKEEAEEVKIQEQEILEKESGDLLIREFKEAETVEEQKEARRELKSQLPNSLRSLKGWETRRGKAAFRSIFEEI